MAIVRPLKTTKDKILEVMRVAERPLAVHEFKTVIVTLVHEDEPPREVNALLWIGASENALSARLRELWAVQKVNRKPREGEAFKEWTLAPTPHCHGSHCDEEQASAV